MEKARFYHHGFATGSGMTHFIMDRETGAPIAYRQSRVAAENYADRLNCDTNAAAQLFSRRIDPLDPDTFPDRPDRVKQREFRQQARAKR